MTQDNKPLTKKDFFAGLGEFFEKILAPYLEDRFGRVENRLDNVENQLDSMDRKFDLVTEKVTDQERKLAGHEERITTLETSPH